MGSISSKSDSDKTTTTLLSEEDTIILNDKNTTLSTTTTQKVVQTFDPMYDGVFKVVISGPSNVGKSCFLHRLVESTFEHFLSTTGVDFRTMVVSDQSLDNDEKKVLIQFWDTAGQERYWDITRPLFINSDLVIIVVDVTTNEKLNTYNEHIHDIIVKNGNPRVIVLGTKVDVSKRVKTREDVLKPLKEVFKVEYEFPYFEVSSLTGFGIEKVCEYISEYALREYKAIKREIPTESDSTELLTPPSRIITKKRKCVVRDDYFTKQNVVLLTTKQGLLYGEESSFWQKLFPYNYTISSGACFKIDEEILMVEIEHVHSSLCLYFNEKTIMNDYLKEWKSVFSTSNFQNISLPYKEYVKIYKIRCTKVGVTPVEHIYKLFNEMTLSTHSSTEKNLVCNVREMLRDQTSKQKITFFSTISWITNINTLDLGNNKLVDSDIKELCKWLIGLPYISSLLLSNNTELTKNACVHLVDMFLKRESFDNLSMSGCNKISNEGAIILLSCINIKTIDLSRCGLEDVVANKIVILSKNSSLDDSCGFNEIRVMLNKFNVKKFEENLGKSNIKIDIIAGSADNQTDQAPEVSEEKLLVQNNVVQQTSAALIKNRYKIEKKIGKGGFGTIYKVFDELNKESVALKSIDFDNIYELEKAFDEISHHQKLAHKYIVNIIDFTMSATDMKLYIIMPLFELGDLNHIISQYHQSGEHFSEKLIANLLLQSAQALNYILENHKLLHCDIKPANLLIKSINNAKGEIHVALNDFGLSLHVSSKSKYVSDIGYSPHYSSPETIEGKGANFKCDVFSLGVTVFHMMSATSPCIWKLYMGNYDAAILRKQLREMIKQNYSDQLVDLVLGMISHMPEDRPDYSTIQEISKQLLELNQ